MNEENLTNESVLEETENSYQAEENLSENKKRAKLIQKIHKIQDEIRKLRNQLGDRYMKAYVSFKEIMENRLEKKENVESFQNKQLRVPRILDLMFYGMFMKMEISKDQSSITILLLVPGKKTFGLNFIRNVDSGFFKLNRCCLPYSLNVNEQMLKANSFTKMQIIKYVESIQVNIYAYHMRTDQVKQLQVRIDKTKVHFYHSMCYMHIELTFRVVDDDLNRSRVTVMMLYNPLEVRPKCLNLNIPDNDISTEQQELLLQKLESFKGLSLPEFYDAVFSVEAPFKFV